MNQNESVCQVTGGTVDQDPCHDVVGAGTPLDPSISSIEKPKPSQGPKQGLSNKIFYGNRGRSRPLSRGRGIGRSGPRERLHRPIRPTFHNGSSPSRSRSNIGSRSTRTRPRRSARGRSRPPGTNSASRPSSRPTGNGRPTDHGFIWEKIQNDRKFRKSAEKKLNLLNVTDLIQI